MSTLQDADFGVKLKLKIPMTPRALPQRCQKVIERGEQACYPDFDLYTKNINETHKKGMLCRSTSPQISFDESTHKCLRLLVDLFCLLVSIWRVASNGKTFEE